MHLRFLRVSITIAFLLLGFSNAFAKYKTMTWYPDSTIIFSGAVAFDKVEVVSLRKEKNFLSYSKSGWNGYGILMADTIHLALASHLDHAFHKAKKSEGKLLIILHDFSVQGLKGLPRLGAAHLRAEIFVGTDDNYYLVNAFDEYQEVDNGKNAFLSINSVANMVFERLVNAIKTDSTKAKSPMFSRTEANELCKNDEE